MECTDCEQPITNPLCPACLGEATAQWLQEYAPERLEGLQREVSYLCETHMGTTCIRCTKQFNVCMYCSTKHLFNWLKTGTLQIRYIRLFNFLT